MRNLTLRIFVPLALVLTVAFAISHCRQPISSCMAEPEPDNDWNWDSHIGSVESIRIEDAELGLSNKPLLRQITKFNRSGQKIEEALYRDDGVALPKTTDSYDSQGH